MVLTTAEKIKIIAARRKITLSDLAEITGQSRQNLNHKLTRDNFSENEIKKIAKALDCEFIGSFKLNDTEEII